MADTKLTALTALTGANVATNDLLYIGDVSATTAGSKSITIQEFLTAILGSTSKTGATETTSKPLLNLAQTWNAGAVTFTGLTLNVTDTASAAASKLLDLQVGGSTLFQVFKSGTIQGSGTTTIAAYGTTRLTVDAATTSITNDLYLFTGQKIIWNNDAFISRQGAANLQLGAADAASPVAQTLSTQGNTTVNGNGVSLTIKAGAGNGTGIGGALYLDGGISGAAGTGGAIIFRTAPAAAGGTLADRWTITSAGHLVPGTTNTYDIGVNSSARPRNIYAVGNIVAADIYGSNSIQKTSIFAFTGSVAGCIVISDASTFNSFDRLQFGGTSSSYPAIKRSTTSLQAKLADDSAYAPFYAQVVVPSTTTVASLPTASSYTGAIAYVNDASATTPRSTVLGGGANKVIVFSDGTNWLIVA